MKNPPFKIAFFLFFFLITFAANSQAQVNSDETPIKIETQLLNIPVIAGDRDGRNVGGLTKEDFSVVQDGERMPIEFFANTEAPMNMAIVIDSSVSTRSVLGDIKKAARNFVALFGAEDKGLIASFDNELNVQTTFTSDQKQLKKAIDSISIARTAGSNMFDAVHTILMTHFAKIKGRKAIILLTDGDVSGRVISRRKFLDTLIESDTLVYPIFFQTFLLFSKEVKTVTMDELVRVPPVSGLNDFALATGGRLYAANGSDFKGAFQQIADDLKKQYLIGFYPKESENGKPIAVNIKANRQDVVIRTKRTIRIRKPGS